MARVDSPLFGMAADGQVGKSLVFARWKGTRYARRYSVPANPKTEAQQNVRGVFSFLVSLFKIAPATFKAPWEAKAKGEPLTPVNAFIKANAAYLQGQTGIDNLAVSTGVLGGLAPASGSISGGSGTVSIGLTAPGLPQGWAVQKAVFVVIPDQSPASVFTGAIQVEEDTSSPYSATFSGLSAGDYHASGYFVFTRDDGRVAYGPPVADVVTVS